MDPQNLAGQAAGFVALALCLLAFASKDDDRLLVILVFGNVAFAVQFALFGAFVASAISALIIVRIVLARRFAGSWPATLAILAATVAVAAATWQGPADVFPLIAGLCGTVAMFMLRGIPMRLGLAAAAVAWIVTNALIGSIGALLAESLILVTNLVTVWRIRRDNARDATA